MDPKRFYKRAEKGKFAAKFAVGTVIEGPAEFFSSNFSLLLAICDDLDYLT